ncbi:hypothetical protein [Kitasatospora sp. P5_F3]
MRYLTGSFALGALRRGRRIEQFLGAAGTPDNPGIRWVEIRPVASGFLVMLHAAQDVGGEHFRDLVEFPALDSDGEDEDFGQEIAMTEEESAAMAIAEASTGAVPDRWVNAGIAQDDYLDFVRAGRPPHLPATELS